MRLGWVALFLLLGLEGLGQEAIQLNGDTTVDYIMFPLDSFSRRYINVPDATPALLTVAEILAVDSILNICIAANNNGGHPYIHGVHIGKYQFKHQLVPFYNERGEKLVWVNSMCWGMVYPDEVVRTWHGKETIPGIDWHKDLIKVHDGGNCYWQVTVNLYTLTYSGLRVNGF